jgi:O-antigen ligase
MASISEESESDAGGGGRLLFWSIAWDLAKIYPWGVGGWGFAYLSPQYVPQEFMPRNASIRAVHSLYFQCLVERGYLGAALWFTLMASSILFIRKTQKFLHAQKDNSNFFLGVALESGFLAFLAAATFLNRLNSEILYWQVLFSICFGNIYLLKRKSQNDYG